MRELESAKIKVNSREVTSETLGLAGLDGHVTPVFEARPDAVQVGHGRCQWHVHPCPGFR